MISSVPYATGETITILTCFCGLPLPLLTSRKPNKRWIQLPVLPRVTPVSLKHAPIRPSDGNNKRNHINSNMHSLTNTINNSPMRNNMCRLVLPCPVPIAGCMHPYALREEYQLLVGSSLVYSCSSQSFSAGL